ncbi:MAG: L-threonine 3-dehydrogenase [Lachnospiraceae bacterium]|jgi:threonine 3-dehydrogenase|nr:L-threonine 3-dehydrogenase [Lachnospiraceae bacterium]
MSKTMYALVKSEAGVGLTLERVPIPEVGPNDVKIKIHKTSICGTDLHIYNWDEWSQATIKIPTVIGHEYVGEIVEVGEAVSEYQVGQTVTGEGHITCGTCRNCREGNKHLCRNAIGVGVNRNGAFAEYLVIPKDNVVPVTITDTITESMVSSFDPLGNAVHTALSFDMVGEDVLITGCGAIGIMAAAIAHHVGARRVVVTDVNDYRLNLCKEITPSVITVNVAKEKLEDAMKKIGLKEGFDIGLEMSGNGPAFSSMIDNMNNGGKIAVLGIHAKQPQVDWQKIVWNGLTIRGIYGRKVFDTWNKMIFMLESGLDVRKVLTHEFDFKDFQKGFDVMNTGKSGKVVLDWTSAHQE